MIVSKFYVPFMIFNSLNITIMFQPFLDVILATRVSPARKALFHDQLPWMKILKTPI